MKTRCALLLIIVLAAGGLTPVARPDSQTTTTQVPDATFRSPSATAYIKKLEQAVADLAVENRKLKEERDQLKLQNAELLKRIAELTK
jgi:hypothetical protein